MVKTTLDMQMEEEGWIKCANVSKAGIVDVQDIDLIETLKANNVSYRIKNDPEVPITSVNSLYVRRKDYDRIHELMERSS